MVTWENSFQMVNGEAVTVSQGACLSTDTKPTTGVANGSVLIEMDTKTAYFFDAANSIWRAWA